MYSMYPIQGANRGFLMCLTGEATFRKVSLNQQDVPSNDAPAPPEAALAATAFMDVAQPVRGLPAP